MKASLAAFLALALAPPVFAAMTEGAAFPLNGSLENAGSAAPRALKINPLTGASPEPQFVPGPKGRALRVTGDRCAEATDLAGFFAGDDLALQFTFRVDQQQRPALTLVSVSLPSAWLEIQLDGRRGMAQLILKLFSGAPPKGVPPLEPMTLDRGEAFHDGKWHHLALVVDRKREGEVRVYLDKAKVSSSDALFLPDLSGTPQRQKGWVAFGAGVPWAYGLPGAKGAPDDLAFDLAEVMVAADPEPPFEVKTPLNANEKKRAAEFHAHVLKMLGL